MTEPLSPSVDGISKGAPVSSRTSGSGSRSVGEVGDDQKLVGRMKFVILLFIGLPYAAFLLWCAFLLAVLPDRTGTWDVLIPLGKLTAVFGGAALILVAVFAVMRIGKNPGTAENARYMGFIRIGLFVLPGIVLSGMVPLVIAREPSLRLAVSNPPAEVEMVAPLSVTFSAEEAQQILGRRGFTIRSFQWDFGNDGKFEEETVTPEATAFFERQGGYDVVAKLTLSDGSTRKLRKRLAITKAVFSYTPIEPVVDQAVQFSVEHLVPQDAEVKLVEWDFDDDGVIDESGVGLTTAHTFIRTGDQKVSVQITFMNQSQNSFWRVIRVTPPKPLPFPVAMKTSPEFLEGPPPFQVVFRVETEEPLLDVSWDFGDDSPPEIGDRVGHTFRARGAYQVTATLRSQAGEVAKVSQIVKVVNFLRINDLLFDGSHKVVNDVITAEAPVTVELTPKTGLPLVDFFWEAPDASDVYSTDHTLRAVYREEGTYNLVLIGQDAEGSVLRKVITLELKPRSNSVDFDMKPQQGVAPLEVEFDASESFVPGEVITGFVWDFGDAGGESQRLDTAKVRHVYRQAGTFTVTLTVYTTSGKELVSTKTIVVRAPFLGACFTMSRSTGAAPLGVRFDRSCSTGDAVKVLWDFDDGSQSDDSEEVLIHEFRDPGRTYTVELRIEDKNGLVSTYEQDVTTE